MIFKSIKKVHEGAFVHRYDISYETKDGRKKIYEMISRNPRIKTLEDLQKKEANSVVLILHDESGCEMVERLGNFYPVVRLHQFYGIETDIDTLDSGVLMWVEASDRSFCIFVDELVGEQQAVVKPLPKVTVSCTKFRGFRCESKMHQSLRSFVYSSV